MEEPLLAIESLRFSYPGVRVLDALNLRVSSGEILGFVGANGAGKTTTFLLATGFLRPDAGQIRTCGVDPISSARWRPQVGLVLARSGHYGRLSVRRNLKFFADLYGVRLDLDAHMAQFGLSDVADKAVAQLSTGYRQRLTIARATVHSPRLLLLDEPTDGLDPTSTDELHREVQRWKEKGIGVLLTSHRLDEVEQLCTRIVVLKDGRAIFDGSPQEVRERAGSLRGLLVDGRQETETDSGNSSP